MTDSKQREKERLNAKSLEEMRGWLSTMPLSIQNPMKNLQYIADFVTVAAQLELPQNSRVLEIGAGSCWPSEWLYRMGYRTVSSDISVEMLRLGRDRFQPLRREKDNFALYANFVCADGEHLPFRNGSFDGVIVFNALHHFPAPEKAIAEIFRVLSDRGRLVFAEPGEGHSGSEEARREMDEHGVLERDIEIREVAKMAAEAGFTDTEVILHRFPDTSLSLAEWEKFSSPYRGWRYKTHLVSDLVRRQRLHPCLVLKKGEGRFIDSRRPGLLKAEISDVEVPPEVQAGHPFRIKVKVINRGDTRWISQGSFLDSGAMNLGEGGYVALGVKLLSREGMTLDDNFGRGPLGDDVPPGGEAEISAILKAPGEGGYYRLKLDLVDEGISWFEDRGSMTVQEQLKVSPSEEAAVFDSRFPDRLEGIIVLSLNTISVVPGERTVLDVKLENRGNTVWRARSPEDDPPAFGGGYVRLGWQLMDSDGKLIDMNYGRMTLPADVHPGDSAVLKAEIKSPVKYGEYKLRFDLVDEGIAWFSERGSETTDIALSVLRPEGG